MCILLYPVRRFLFTEVKQNGLDDTVCTLYEIVTDGGSQDSRKFVFYCSHSCIFVLMPLCM